MNEGNFGFSKASHSFSKASEIKDGDSSVTGQEEEEEEEESNGFTIDSMQGHEYSNTIGFSKVLPAEKKKETGFSMASKSGGFSSALTKAKTKSE